ncbi:MAG: LysR family transcriptional regulator [Lachnospiraceae bacterium]
MEIRVLRYFLMVAREENITRAAELLHVTQPTLSRQLMQLEEELGVKLFQRSNHSIRLTEDGMLLRKRAQDIVSLADKTENEFHHKEDNLAGEIAIGSGESRNVQSLAKIISLFQKKYPGVRYDFYTANADDIKERLDRGLLDIGLLMEPVDISKYNFVRLEKRERWGVLVRQDSELAQKDTVTPADLIYIPLIMVKRALVQNELANWFGDYYDQIHVVATYNLINNAAVMVENGIGAALCIKLENAFGNLRFIPLSSAIDTGAVLVWRKNQLTSRAAHQFIEFVKNCRNDIS